MRKRKKTPINGESKRSREAPSLHLFSPYEEGAEERAMLFRNNSEKIAKKSGEDQSAVMAWIRTKLSFALVRTSVVCLRGLKKKDKRKHFTDNKETEFAISRDKGSALINTH